MSDLSYRSQAARQAPSPTTGLAPIIAQRLHEFRQRRLQVHAQRGAIWSWTVFVLCVMAGTLLDRLLDYNWVPWAVCLAIYGLTLAVVYVGCVRPYLGPAVLSDEAAALEAREACLRDRLLSAVELSDRPADAFDSPAFRQQLQMQVARLVEPLSMRQLVSSDRLRRARSGALLASGLYALLCLVPGLHLPQRSARCLLPWMDFGRVSQFAIWFEQPSPHAQHLPQGDLVAFTACVSGQPQTIWLETRSADRQQRLALLPIAASDSPETVDGAQRFGASLPIESSSLEYRAIAEGSRTPWYRLTTAPRPTVERFVKRVQPPQYSQLPETTSSATHGDIETLSGSSVELRLDIDQPLSRAELHWQADSQEEQQLALTQDQANGQYVARWDIVESGTYRLVLESAVSGFTNAFARRHTVTALADMPPRLTWLQPEQTLIAASATELLALRMQIDDELPLTKLEQWSRVAEGAWQQVTLPLPSSRSQQIAEWSFDLMPVQPPTGAQVETKVLATDRRGATSESVALRVLISSTSLDLEATPAELARLRLARQLADLTTRIDGIESLAVPANATQPTPNSESQRLQTAGRALHRELSRSLPSLVEEAELALSVCEDRVSWKELRWVADILSGTLSTEVSSLSEQSALPLDASEQQIRQRAQTLALLVQRLTALAAHLRTAASHDVARRYIASMARMAAAQEELSQSATADTEALRRRQRVLNQQLRQLQASMLEATMDIQPLSQERWRASAERVGTLIDQLESQIEDASSDRLRRLMAATANSLDEGRLMARVDSLIYEQLKRAHRWLADQTESPADLLTELAEILRDHGIRHPTTALVDAATNQNLSAKRRQIRTGVQGDPVWTSDLGLTVRAIQALREEPTTSSRNPTQPLETLADALRVLETAAELRLAIAELRDLHACERWSHQAIEAFTESPRRWDSLLHQFERIATVSRHTSVPPTWTRQVTGLRGHSAAVQAGSTLAIRRSNRTQPKTVAPQLQELNVPLRELQATLRPLEVQARSVLRALSPTVVELAQQAAAETRATSQQTSELGQQTRDQESAQPPEKLRQLSQRAQQLQPPLQRLREALVDQADAQDLLDRSQIELAAKSDAAITMLDRIQGQALQAQTAIELLLSTAQETDLAVTLFEAAKSQADAADGLDQVARYLSQATPTESLSGGTPPTAGSAGRETFPEPTADYERARALADLAASDPTEVLRALEQQLKQDRPMQQELETITDTSAAEALIELERAAAQQARLAPDLARSDPHFRAFQDLLEQDLQTSQAEASQLLTTFLREAQATAFASRATAQERAFEALQTSLQEALDNGPLDASQSDWRDMLHTAHSLQELFVRLQQASEQLATQMKHQGTVAIHESGASVKNRRREMRDRQRRIFQQDIRNLQQAERSVQQRQRQADSVLKQSRQQLVGEMQKLQKLAAQRPVQPGQEAASQTLQTLQVQVALLGETVEANAFLAQAFRERALSATTRVQQANRRQAAELAEVNPSAELSADLLSTLAERFAGLVQRLETWNPADPNPPRATRQAVNEAVDQQATIASQLAASSEKIGRARRHQGRLGNREASARLSEFAQRLDTQLAETLAEAQRALRQAQLSAEQTAGESGRAATATTVAATQATDQAANAIAEAASRLRGLLQAPTDEQESALESTARASSTAAPATNAPSLSASTLSPQQMAQLLDELDRQLNAAPTKPDAREAPQLGPQDNNAHNPPGNQQALSETLAEAAQRMAAQFSQNREAPASPSNTDLGLGTEPQWADSHPRAPVAVESHAVRRQGQAWGELRSQRSEGTTESRFPALAPRYREQVEAYFKNLSIQSGETSDAR